MNVPSKREYRFWNAFSLALVLGCAALFYIPALQKTAGLWPVPLDDVYIYFDFAKSTANGHPFEWIAGQGYSSGSTSVIYPLFLAIGYLIGFSGLKLGIFAAIFSCACVFDMCRSARALLPGCPRFLAWLAPPILLSVPLLDWSFYSGMETALFAALLGRSLVALRQAETSPAHRRKHAQWRAGIYGALLVSCRPESLCFCLPMAISAVYSARSLPAPGSLFRTLSPAFLFLASYSIVNRIFTSEWSAAGAVRKLLSSNPYATLLDIAPEFLRNLITLRAAAIENAMGYFPYSLVVPLLGFSALFSSRFRPAAISLWLGSIGSLLLVSLNATARFQNLRYAAPSILMLLFLFLFGLSHWATRRHNSKLFPIYQTIVIIAWLVAMIAPARFFPWQIDLFARSSKNIAEQQVEVGRRLARMNPKPNVVMLNDAGAIPYVSGLRALDGLGLGGYLGLPFARASVHGNFAVVELIERLSQSDRPDVMAVYSLWWPDIIRYFGQRVDSVKVEGNVILGAEEKVICKSDWSALEGAGKPKSYENAIDEIDIADLVSEREHHYLGPFPKGGWVIGDVRPSPISKKALFDGGRILPEGREEAFSLLNSVELGPATLILRTDDAGSALIRIEIRRNDECIESIEHPVLPGERAMDTPSNGWIDMKISLSKQIQGGDSVHIYALRGSFRHFHSWLLRN